MTADRPVRERRRACQFFFAKKKTKDRNEKHPNSPANVKTHKPRMDDFDARMRTLMRAPRLDVDRVLQGSLRTTRTMLSDRGCAWVDACDPSRLRAAMLAGEPVVVAGPAPQTRVFFHVEDRISIRAIRTVMDDEEETQIPTP